MKYLLTALIATTLFSCHRPIYITKERPNLRRVEVQVFTDEKKIFIFIPPNDKFWKP